MSSWEKCLFRSAHVSIGLFAFLTQSCVSCLYVLEMNLLSALFADTFPHSEVFVFSFCLLWHIQTSLGTAEDKETTLNKCQR